MGAGNSGIPVIAMIVRGGCPYADQPSFGVSDFFWIQFFQYQYSTGKHLHENLILKKRIKHLEKRINKNKKRIKFKRTEYRFSEKIVLR